MTSMREGFVPHSDEEADVQRAPPQPLVGYADDSPKQPHKPKVVYNAPRGPEAGPLEQLAAEARAEAEESQRRYRAPAEPPADEMAKLDKDRNAPPPIDLDAPAEDIEWPIKLKLLYKPTRDTKNRIIHELLIRAPTAGDISLCGNPVRLNSEGDVIVDEQKMTAMLARLSDVFPPMIEQLDARDWISCSFFMQRILLPNRRTWEPTLS
jgi:hypothetical protein